MIDIQFVQQLIDEKKARKAKESSYIAGNKPGWNQMKIHASDAGFLVIFGGNQSGKSHTAAKEIDWRLRGNHPHKETTTPPVLCWCISSSYSTLRSGIYRHLMEMIPPYEVEKYGPKVQQHDMHSFILLKNGSRVEFHSARGYEDARDKLQAAKVDIISIDEEIPEVIYEELIVRQLAAHSPVFIISATLVNSEPYMVALEERSEQGDPNVCLTRLNTSLNPMVNTKVLAEVLKQLSPEDQKVRIEGRSKRFSGLVYKEFSDKHVVSPFTIPPSWPRFCSIDPGLRTFAILYLTVSPEKHIYVYEEIYEHGAHLYEIASKLRDAEGWLQCGLLRSQLGGVIPKYKPGPQWTPIQWRVIDDKMNSRLVTGDWGVMTQFSLTYGIDCIPANKSKRIGIERVRQALMSLEDDIPELQIFSTCTNLIGEFKSYRYKRDISRITQNETPQEPVKRRDHGLDAIRYALMQNPEYEDVSFVLPDELPKLQEEFNSQDFSLAAYRARKLREKEEEVYSGDGTGSW